MMEPQTLSVAKELEKRKGKWKERCKVYLDGLTHTEHYNIGEAHKKYEELSLLSWTPKPNSNEFNIIITEKGVTIEKYIYLPYTGPLRILNTISPKSVGFDLDNVKVNSFYTLVLDDKIHAVILECGREIRVAPFVETPEGIIVNLSQPTSNKNVQLSKPSEFSIVGTMNYPRKNAKVTIFERGASYYVSASSAKKHKFFPIKKAKFNQLAELIKNLLISIPQHSMKFTTLQSKICNDDISTGVFHQTITIMTAFNRIKQEVQKENHSHYTLIILNQTSEWRR